jgi:TPR repeat protein
MYELGDIFEQNPNVKDLQAAVDWYQRAADNGNDVAKVSVQRLNGQGYYSKENQKGKSLFFSIFS